MVIKEINTTISISGYSSDSSDSSIEMDSSDTSSVAAINTEASSCSEETDSDINISFIKLYQYKPSTGTLDISSEELTGENVENDKRLSNMKW